MEQTGLNTTNNNILKLVEQTAIAKTLLDICYGLADLDITKTMEQLKFTMECFYANKQPLDIVIINSTGTYGLVDPAMVSGYIDKRSCPSMG